VPKATAKLSEGEDDTNRKTHRSQVVKGEDVRETTEGEDDTNRKTQQSQVVLGEDVRETTVKVVAPFQCPHSMLGLGLGLGVMVRVRVRGYG
jgi:hypothetical protein